MAEIERLSAREAAARLSGSTPPRLIDVRTYGEYAIAAIEGSILIPMNEIVERVDELAPDEPLIIVCHHGVRSFRVAAWLVSTGFTHVANLSGGIEAWSLEVDNSVPRY